VSSPSSPRAARAAVLVAFFANGVIFANWVSRIPRFQADLGMSDAALGMVLLAGGIGLILALVAASGLISRLGSHRVTVAGALGLCTALFLLPWMPRVGALAGGLFLFGCVIGTMDVAMNTQAAEVERRYGRPLMSSFHAAWSAGGFVGAGMGAGMVALSAGPRLHFSIVAGVLALVVIVASRNLVKVDGESDGGGPAFQVPPLALLPLGLLALCSGVNEGAIADWGALYLRDVVSTAEGTAALGFTAFSVAMAAARLAGDWLTARLGPATLVRAGGVVAAGGLAAAVAVPDVRVVMLGYGAVGLGLANVIPLAFSAGGNMAAVPPSRGIAGVASVAYGGFLLGPPAIGLVAEVSSLRVSFALLSLLAAAIVVLAGAARPGRTGGTG
jgi:MFS family permease